MTRPLILHLVMASVAAPVVAGPVTFDWAHVGNAGNAADPQTGFGAVAYEYAIAKHEVTNAQYTEFLNATDPTGANTRELYNPAMAGDFGGISKTGLTDGSRYVVKPGRAQNPVSFVSNRDAVRFTNWLHNGQGSGDTEAGVYTISNGDRYSRVRSTGAKYWVPSEDEWYKAAYHDASAGTAGLYFDFANGSDSIPISDQPWENPAAVNYYDYDFVIDGFNDGFAVSGTFTPGPNPLTDVGAYTAAASPYGTFDQNGNVREWNEGDVTYSMANLRGGSWELHWGLMRADFPGDDDDGYERDTGFRVATAPEPGAVPEPSTLLMGALAAVGLLVHRRA